MQENPPLIPKREIIVNSNSVLTTIHSFMKLPTQHNLFSDASLLLSKALLMRTQVGGNTFRVKLSNLVKVCIPI